MLDTIQKRIIALREARGLSRRDVAEGIDEKYTSYCHYEDGSMEIRASVLYKLSIFYNQSADWIVGLEDNEKSPPPETKWETLKEELMLLSESDVDEVLTFVRFLKWKAQDHENDT